MFRILTIYIIRRRIQCWFRKCAWFLGLFYSKGTFGSKTMVFGTFFRFILVFWPNEARYGKNVSRFGFNVKNWIRRWKKTGGWQRFLPEKNELNWSFYFGFSYFLVDLSWFWLKTIVDSESALKIEFSENKPGD